MKELSLTLSGGSQNIKNSNAHSWAGCWQEITIHVAHGDESCHSLASKPSESIYDIYPAVPPGDSPSERDKNIRRRLVLAEPLWKGREETVSGPAVDA